MLTEGLGVAGSRGSIWEYRRRRFIHRTSVSWSSTPTAAEGEEWEEGDGIDKSCSIYFRGKFIEYYTHVLFFILSSGLSRFLRQALHLHIYLLAA